MTAPTISLSHTGYALLSATGTLCAAVAVWCGGSLFEESARRAALNKVSITDAPVDGALLTRFDATARRNDLMVDLVSAGSDASSRAKLRAMIIEQVLRAPLATRTEVTPLADTLLVHHLPHLRKLAVVLDETLAAEAETTASLSSLHTRENRMRSAFDLIALDLSELLSLERAPAPRNVPLPMYRSGVLANLPIMKGLEDGVINLTQLRDALSAAGGKVNVKNASPTEIPALFQEKLTSLTQNARSLLNEYEALLGEQQTAEQTAQQAREAVRNATQKLRELSKSQLLATGESSRT